MNRCAEIYHMIAEHPGVTTQELSAMMGLDYDTLRNSLSVMDGAGYLLSEDGKGRLYPFAINRTGVAFSGMMARMCSILLEEARE